MYNGAYRGGFIMSTNIAYQDEFVVSENDAYDKVRCNIKMSSIDKTYNDAFGIKQGQNHQEKFDMSGNSAYSTTLPRYE